MNFFDNVVKSSNAIIKDRLNNPFGKLQQSSKQADESQSSSAADQPPQEQSSQVGDAPSSSAATTTDAAATAAAPDGESSQFAAIAADAEAVTQKAVKGAKDIGSFLFSMANKAGQTVTQTAKQVKQAVESTSILTDFTREQQEFIKEHGGSIQAGELPWACYADDDVKMANIKEQILMLSQDRRNFVRSPPSEANFHFDQQQCYPVALTLLKEDPNLGKMRFELVPKLVNEDTFWRNYFYRVSLLKQMVDKGEDVKKTGWSSSRSSSGEGPDDETTIEEVNQATDTSYSTTTTTAQQSNTNTSTTIPSTATITNEAITGTQDLESDESRKLVAEADDLKSKLKELNIGSFDDPTQDEKWEEELQRDLQEFELVSGDGDCDDPMDERVLDDEIMELKKSASNK